MLWLGLVGFVRPYLNRLADLNFPKKLTQGSVTYTSFASCIVQAANSRPLFICDSKAEVVSLELSGCPE
jgi:hypothetical protein